MQAIVLFVMFGVLMATVSGIISTGSESTRQITLNRTEATKKFFIEAENILRDRITFQEMEITPTSQCNGAAVSSTPQYTDVGGQFDPRPYLCRMEVRQLASWDMGPNNVSDPWRNDITGVVVRRMQAVGPGVLAPVTAMAIISPGQDRVVSPNLLAALRSVRLRASAGTATFNEVLSLSAELDRGVNFTDDIVHTFSNLTTQQDRWQEISGNTDRILVAMQQSYMDQYEAFQPTLNTYYQNNPTAIITSMYSWKLAALSGMPALNSTTINVAANRRTLGVDEAFQYITMAIPVGSGMSLGAASFNGGAVAGATDLDSMRITVTNNSAPWTVNYSKTITMAP